VRIAVHNRCSDFVSYRAARVKSLFNAESGCNFDLDAELPIDDGDWRIGLIVGPSGSGKTSMGRLIFGPEALYEPAGWPSDKPIIDAIAPDGDFDAVTSALAAVGLGSVPSWLRPYSVLSNGEKFRADLARIICEAPERVVIDEFTSVVDRQIAKFSALAFQKAWRRTKSQAVLLSCHYDIIEWVEPDWVFDTATGKFAGRGLWRRPRFDLEIWQTDWRYWHLFEPHHYLKLPKMIAARCYVGTVDGELVAHVAVGTRNVGKGVEARACRLVVMPEWQGAGVGMRFLNEVCQLQLDGRGRLPGRRVTTIFHTSHPGLCGALRRDRKWVQLSAVLHGSNKRRSRRSMVRSGNGRVSPVGYGDHFRAVQGFRYLGERS
jgi:ABC-type ATPase involved in cell division/GNAT superfamily N-acetyltransferase